jgi:hypothetical protein
MKDYTWQARSAERHFDSHGKVESTKRETGDADPGRTTAPPHAGTGWEAAQPGGAAQRAEKARSGDRQAEFETQAERHAAWKKRKSGANGVLFSFEIPDLFDLRLEGDSTVDGRPVWVVSGAPRPGAQPKSRDAKMLLKIRGRMWIDKATYQWAKVEAETTGTISWGLFLARLNAGAKLVFEQAEVNSEIWLPKRLFLTGSGRVGLVKRIAQDEEIQWSNYKKFSVDSKIVTDSPPKPRNLEATRGARGLGQTRPP